MLVSCVSRRGKLKGELSAARNWRMVVACSDNRREIVVKRGNSISKRKILFDSLVLCAALCLIALLMYKPPLAFADEVEYPGVPIESLASDAIG